MVKVTNRRNYACHFLTESIVTTLKITALELTTIFIEINRKNKNFIVSIFDEADQKLKK